MLSESKLRMMNTTRENEILFNRIQDYVRMKFDPISVMDVLSGSKQKIFFSRINSNAYDLAILKNRDHIEFSCTCSKELMKSFEETFGWIDSCWHDRASTRLNPTQIGRPDRIYRFIDKYYDEFISKYQKGFI